jgi:hypothetical protein
MHSETILEHLFTFNCLQNYKPYGKSVLGTECVSIFFTAYILNSTGSDVY